MPLQKSFSETNHSSKAKPQHKQSWNRNRSLQGQQPSVKKDPLSDKPPIPISTATRNKLSIFQFGGQGNDEDGPKEVISLLSSDEKENEGARTRTIRHKPENALQASQELLPRLERPACPSTPAGRGVLPDLIGMGDVQKVVQQISPEERIGWDHNKDAEKPSEKRSKLLGPVRRARKRARSSSPTDPATHGVDPGSELWGRYSLNGSTTATPQGHSIPALAHIMHTSSPQPTKDGSTPRPIAGFRRANSCGNQFPKRRRVGGPEAQDIFTETASIGPSKLSVLIERVQVGLLQPKRSTTPQMSSSSSNTPSKVRSFEEDESPVHHNPRKMSITVESVLEIEKVVQEEPEQDISQSSPVKSVKSSDYGDFDDDDLDEGILETLIKTTDMVILKSSSTTTSKPPTNPPPNPRQSSKKVQLQCGKTQTVKQAGKNEFDDSDDDMLAADMELIVSQFDRGTSVGKVLPKKKEETGQNHVSKRIRVDSDDEFGDIDLDDGDFVAAEVATTQSIQQTATSLLPSTQKVQAIQRYLVTNVLDSEFQNANGRTLNEKILLLQIESTKATKMVHLRGIWIEAPVIPKAFVHVIGLFDSSGRCIIDDDHNILILHPDHLISSTVVADSFGCIRRAVLQDRVKATSDSSAPLVYGTILHEIFQASMVENRWDTEWMRELIERVVHAHLEDLYTIKVQLAQAVEYLLSKVGELQSWAELFVSSQPKPEAKVKDRNGDTATMCVSKLLDVEEHVWSPMYGLKGNIDATVQVTMVDGKQRRTLTVPFEVKTGKNPSAAHRAQTALYNLLLSDRYDVEIAYGILYYMETSETIRIPTIRHELRHMIMQRNELACFVRERHAQLPPMLKKENLCNRCYAKVPCFIYHRLADNGTGDTSGMKTKFDEVVKHLTPKHKEFFLKWDSLLTKEEKESLKFRRELWTMLSTEREKLGRCFANVVIEPGSAYEEKNKPKINRYRYTLVKEESPASFSFLESQITIGEPIVISDEKGHFALANGYVTHVRKRRITVAVDRRLHNARIRRSGFDETDNQVFASIMEVAQEKMTPQEAEESLVEKPVKYRLDKDEFSNGMATVRNNIIQVMADGPFGSRKIRGLVVDLNAPRFKTQATQYTLRNRESINVDQRRAIQKVMSAEDYALVLGMPGTGKTTTIAHIIRALVSQGKSVLLTSYTHTAVDNILLKLKDDAIPILRLGAIAKISPEVQTFARLASTPKETFEEIRSQWHDSPIVATTCLGISHAIFNERTFDYCIVDEASQITLPVCLGPIRLASTFILVGDHYQLPPLVQNEDARKGGLDISLFKHLSDTHPSSVVYLEHQYRMCADVMALSNSLIYDGRLKCGSQAVADRTITIPHMENLSQHHFSPASLSLSQTTKSFCPGPARGSCWLRDLLDPETKVAFINTDSLGQIAREQAKGNRIVNPTEATICTQLVEALITVGIDASEIGVMTHYRSQLALLKYLIGKQGKATEGVEMHTADRFQGRDKEVIVLSLVRSNEMGSIGELLKDWRRINVAFTRAKTKLLVVGSSDTLKGRGKSDGEEEEMVSRFVKLMEEKRWIYELKDGCLESHWFEEAQTQATAATGSVPGSQWIGGGDLLPAKKRKVSLGKGKENIGRGFGVDLAAGNGIVGKRQPIKTISGQKPFKIPRMGVLDTVLNEVMG